MINHAVVICSHLGSKRIKEKVFYKFEGRPVIEHLLDRVKNMPVIVAVPTNDLIRYSYLPDIYGNLRLFAGVNDPLKRMAAVVEKYQIRNVIRICHDKIFVDEKLINLAVDEYDRRGVDYLYSSSFTDGSGFEIISGKTLVEAADKFKDCEHISYAARETTDNLCNFSVPEMYRSSYRLLMDYPEDIALLNKLSMNFSLPEALDYLFCHEKIAKINELPKLTIYTCAYNAKRWLQECISSVLKQKNFREFEYIFIDDCSEDGTLELAEKILAANYRNIKIIRNKQNIGLAASSNIALANARGKYIMRLDADDFFQYQDSCSTLLGYIEKKGYDAVYCGNQLQRPSECHHIGGTIFNKKEINYIKFSEQLRGYEGYDFFLRAKDRIKIGYFYKPLWFYRQHPKSMSKTNMEGREKIKMEIENAAQKNDEE